jgi:hypothetical protein
VCLAAAVSARFVFVHCAFVARAAGGAAGAKKKKKKKKAAAPAEVTMRASCVEWVASAFAFAHRVIICSS